METGRLGWEDPWTISFDYSTCFIFGRTLKCFEGMGPTCGGGARFEFDVETKIWDDARSPLAQSELLDTHGRVGPLLFAS